MKRECGTCTMCCVVFAIDDLGKAAGIPCVHLMPGGGCEIYEERPNACRSFRCSWHMGDGDFTMRPDRMEALGTLKRWGLILYLDPRRPNQWERVRKWSKLINAIPGRGLFTVMRDEVVIRTMPDGATMEDILRGLGNNLTLVEEHTL